MKKSIPFKYVLAVSVALATAAVYLSSLRNGFVEFDDPFYIVDNPNIRFLNMGFFRWAIFDFYASNWHPLTWLSHAIDYAVWGLNPLGHHLTNLILHAVNSFFVVLVTIKLMEAVHETTELNGQSTLFNPRSILTTAGVTGLLFGLHPIHVESVAWVSERKDLLCALFFLLSIMMYANYVRSVRTETRPGHHVPRIFQKHFSLSLGFFLLALLSKPMAVTLPLVLLILDWYPFNRITSRSTLQSAFFEKLPFLAFSLISSILTVLAQHSGGALQPLEITPLLTRFLVAARSVVMYLWKMAWPHDLIPYYSYPRNVSLWSAEYFLSCAFIVAITAGCLIMARIKKAWLTAWCYYLVTLIPVIGIVQVGGQPMADRYTYLPGLGPFFLVGIAAATVWEAAYTKERWQRVRPLIPILALVVIISMGWGTVRQIALWGNGLDLWTAIIEKNDAPPPLAYYNRGIAFYKLGRLDRALTDNDMAIALNPDYHEAYNNRGQVFDRAGQLDKAIANYDKAIALNPSYCQTYYNRGIAYTKLHQFEKAISDFSRTIAMNPSFIEAYNNRGTAYFLSGESGKALEDFDRIIVLNPSNYQAYYNRARVFQKTGQQDKASQDLSTAQSLRLSQ